MITSSPYEDFLQIFRECEDAKFSISSPKIESSGCLIGFKIDSGFSKSGSAEIKCDGNFIDVHTRYNTVCRIENFEDLVAHAWRWYIDSKDRGYGIPEEFKQQFIECGYLKKVIKEYYEEA